MKKAQVIICKCGSKFAACVEPYCYTDKDWLKELGQYVKEGCTVAMINTTEFHVEECKCKKNHNPICPCGKIIKRYRPTPCSTNGITYCEECIGET